MTDQLRQALAGILTIVDESTGVAGYHLNGNLAEWDEFPEVSAARDALAQQSATVASYETFNQWFLDQAPERQAVLREDKWMLACAAYEAGLRTAEKEHNAAMGELRQAVAERDALPRRSGHAINRTMDELRVERRVWSAVRALLAATSEQPDTVKVPRESVRRAVAALRSRMCTECGDEACCMPAMRNSARELRALLGKEGA